MVNLIIGAFVNKPSGVYIYAYENTPPVREVMRANGVTLLLTKFEEVRR